MLKINLINELKQLFLHHQLFSSLIIDVKSQSDSDEIINELIRYMFCQNKSMIDDNCQTCQRAGKKILFDVMYLGDRTNSIDKTEIQNMISKMSLSAVEETQTKVYIIGDAENLKTEAANSLLKFLEEPPHNTFAILLSKDRSAILQTIKSRCKIFVVESQPNTNEINGFEKILLSKNKTTYLLASDQFKKHDKTELIKMLEEGYSRTVIKQFANLAEQTLILINDLKYGINEKLAIDNYFIRIVEEMG